MPSNDQPIPIECLRDLLGVARALYVSWRRDGLGPIEMEELRSVGEDLRAAYQLARRSRPGMSAHRAAWTKAERATRRLSEILSAHETIRELVGSQSDRLGFTDRNAPRFDASAKIRERVKRG